jgi:hypothetical protein
MKTYYCPKGHNVFETASEDKPECAQCGSVMTTDSTRYDDVHERIEEEGIAGVERELAKKGG